MFPTPMRSLNSALLLSTVSILPGGFAAFEPKGLWPATRAAVRKNESSRFAFFPYRKGGKGNNLKVREYRQNQAAKRESEWMWNAETSLLCVLFFIPSFFPLFFPLLTFF
jgi:hypothetical protein